MSYRNQRPSIAVIGAGIAGAACAAGLAAAGWQVTLFDKAREVGGRMATRRVPVQALRAAGLDAQGACADPRVAERNSDAGHANHINHASHASFDHGAQQFTAQSPRFRALLGRAEKLGRVARWQQRVSASFPAPTLRDRFVPIPDMPALCRHLLEAVPVRLDHQVQRLYRSPAGWQLALANGGSVGAFDQVLLAMPPAQAALLLAGHQDVWADALTAVPMTACWTLMAVTDEVDWPWDAAEPERGPLALVARDDRKPGRYAEPGRARWVAHATPQWSAQHLDDDPGEVADELRAALAEQLPCAAGTQPLWHQSRVHRWRYATLAQPVADGAYCWWDHAIGLGVCGEAFGDGTIEGAWVSGDELADVVAAGLECAETMLAENAALALVAGTGSGAQGSVPSVAVTSTSSSTTPTASAETSAALSTDSSEAMH